MIVRHPVPRLHRAVYPGAIHQLANAITTSDLVSCQDANMTTASISNWDASGPFVSIFIGMAGLHTPMGTVNDSIEHNSKKDSIFVGIPNADTALVTRMDDFVDGGDGGATGTIQYGSPSAGVVDMLYQVGLQAKFIRKAHC